MARKAAVYTPIESDRQSFLNAQASLHRADATIRELQQALAAAKAEGDTQRSRADATEFTLNAERDAHARTKALEAAAEEEVIRLRKRVLQVLSGHQKLTAVMKTALSPQQYQDARDEAKALYPHLNWGE